MDGPVKFYLESLVNERLVVLLINEGKSRKKIIVKKILL